MPKGKKVPIRRRPNPVDVQAQFGAAIKACRLRLGVTQEELAWRADLHRTYIADIERGARNVTLRSILNLAEALQVSISELLLSPDENRPIRRADGEMLLVEDSAVDAELTLRAFKAARITNPVRVLKDGAAALDHLLAPDRMIADLPQLILLDLNLPKLSGIEVLRRIRADARTREIPVVVLTVSQDDRNILECARLGAKNYIIKPVGFDKFTQVTPHLNLHWSLVKSDRTTVPDKLA